MAGYKQGLDREMEPQGLDREMEPLGLDRGMEPLGLDREMEPQGLDMDMEPQGLDREMEPQGLDREMEPHTLELMEPHDGQAGGNGKDKHRYCKQNDSLACIPPLVALACSLACSQARTPSLVLAHTPLVDQLCTLVLYHIHLERMLRCRIHLRG